VVDREDQEQNAEQNRDHPEDSFDDILNQISHTTRGKIFWAGIAGRLIYIQKARRLFLRDQHSTNFVKKSPNRPHLMNATRIENDAGTNGTVEVAQIQLFRIM
jgi:hypothetical protein